MNILNWIQNLFGSVPAEPELGALLDTRTDEERAAEDVLITELVTAPVVPIYKDLTKDDIRTFPVQNQKQKGSCVAETRKKLKHILFKVNKGIDLQFSSVAFYRKRNNFPAAGMNAANAIHLDKEAGMTLDVLVPSDTVTTEAMAAKVAPEAFNDELAKVFRTYDTDAIFTPGDLDMPAGTIQKTRKGIMMWFYFTSAEWSREVPIVLETTLQAHHSRALRHSVTGIEPARYKGKEGVWIEDSAHFGGLNRRFITKDFYQKRNFYASYPLSFKFDGPSAPSRPSYIEGNIVSLQDCLKFEGVFPSNIDSTGIHGPVTTDAVKKFQAKYGIEQVGSVGPKTTAKLKELYP